MPLADDDYASATVYTNQLFPIGAHSIYIQITKGGAAEATGKLKLGDRILEVNNHNVRFANHQQAVQLLISQLGNIELLVQHVPQPPGLQVSQPVRKGVHQLEY